MTKSARAIILLHAQGFLLGAGIFLLILRLAPEADWAAPWLGETRLSLILTILGASLAAWLVGAMLGGSASAVRRPSALMKGLLPLQLIVLLLLYAALETRNTIFLAGAWLALSGAIGATVPPGFAILRLQKKREPRIPASAWLGGVMLGMIGGLKLTSWLYDVRLEASSSPWQAAQESLYLLILLSLFGQIAVWLLDRVPEKQEDEAPAGGGMFGGVGRGRQSRAGVVILLYGVAVGWSGLLLLGDAPLGLKEPSPVQELLSWRPGPLFFATVGVIFGALLAGMIGQGRASTGAGALPWGVMLWFAFLAALTFLPGETQGMPELQLLEPVVWFLGGEALALLLVPGFMAVIRAAPADQAGAGRAGGGIALILGLAVGIGLICAYLGRIYLDLPPRRAWLITGLLFFPLLIYGQLLMKETILFFLRILFRLVYRVKTIGHENLPEGGYLLLPNHQTWVDTIILHLACKGRFIRFLIIDEIYDSKILNPVFRFFGAIPVSSTRAKDAIAKAAHFLAEGEIVCVFPEGGLSRSGALLPLRRGYELIARKAGVPVIPVWQDRLWGSIFSFQGQKYFNKWPRRYPFSVTVKFGEPMTGKETNPAILRERMLMLAADCFEERPEVKGHLGRVAVKNLRKRQFKTLIWDGNDDTTLKCGTLLAAAIVMAQKLRREVKAPRVGIILPPSKGGLVANLAVTLAGKTPVNLNFTAGKASLESSIKRAEIDTVITAVKMYQRVKDAVPWPDNILHLDKELPPLKKKIVFWRALVFLLPGGVIADLMRMPTIGGHAEGTILFTSGSSGEPKGVVLSHRNVLANVAQFSEALDLPNDAKVLASLPIFHSFGSTVTLWWPLLRSQPMVTYPSPLEVAKNAELVEKHHIQLMATTPTFLRGYLRKASKEQIAPLKMIVTGAEKLPKDLALKFEEHFNARVLEGYGLTETSPVVSTNLPDPPPHPMAAGEQSRYKLGSVGLPMPGLAIQIRHPETGEKLSIHDSGMIWFKGPNIFEGYLKDPDRTAEVFDDDGWFKSGDLGRVDEDGFIFIEGRLSRFSKIGGEMVPHATIESKIIEALNLEGEDEQKVVVTGVPDESKGETLVMLSTVEIEMNDLRQKLRAKDVPNLWIPKTVTRVDEIPVLASGKLDLRSIKEIAEKKAAEGEAEPEQSASEISAEAPSAS